MSAVLQPNYFTAGLNLADGVSVRIEAPTLAAVAEIVAKLQPAANDAKAATPAAPSAPKPLPAAAATAAPTQASAPAAVSGSAAAPSADVKGPTYDDVRACILKLAKVSKDTAVAALAKFGVDAGPKLKLEQYADFLAHADQVLKVPA